MGNRLDNERRRVRVLLSHPTGRSAMQTELVESEPGRELLGAILGRKIQVTDAKADKPVVAILIPSHRQPAHETWHAIDEMVRFSADSIDIVNRPGVSASIVSWSRNQLIADCYKDGVPFTHVLFIDDDAVPPKDALLKLLAHKVDIVAGAMTVRKDPPIPNFRSFDEKEMTFHTAFTWSGEGLINVGAVGTGFMLISREAIEKVGEYYLSCEFEKKYFGMSQEKAEFVSAGRRASEQENRNKFWFELLKQPHGDGEFGEDISFCFKARECGVSVFVDTTIRPGHIGNYPYSLNDYQGGYQQEELAKHEARLIRDAVRKGKPKEGEPDMKISLLVPTRGRPENMKRLFESVRDTATVMPGIAYYIDEDDAGSIAEAKRQQEIVGSEACGYLAGPRIILSQCWNELSKVCGADILMVAADDIVFQTKGWDRQVVSAFQHCEDRILFVHGDDGHWGERFGTHGFLHRDWVNALGYFLPPYFSADWCDTWLNEIADALGRRVYIPFKTEHLHPLFGKAEIDQTHKDRLARGKKDKVAELYAAKADERKMGIEKLRELIAKRGQAAGC